MNITNLKDILSATTTFSGSTITTFRNGKSYNFPSDGEENFYPLLFLEEDYNINTIYNGSNPITEQWSFNLIIVDHLDDEFPQADKDTMRDVLLVDAKNVVDYLNFTLYDLYKGSVISTDYLSLIDFESDNTQGWSLGITINVPANRSRCNPYI